MAYNSFTSFVRKNTSLAVVTTITALAGLGTAAIFTLKDSSSNTVFECYSGTGCNINGALKVDGVSISTGASLTLAGGDARYVNTSGDIMTGTLIISNSKNLQVAGAISGSVIRATTTLSSSGGIISETTISGATIIANTASGFVVRYQWLSPKPLGGTVVGSGSTVATGSGKAMWEVPYTMSGFQLFNAQFGAGVAGTTNATSAQVRNTSQASCKMFTTPVSIDSTERSSLYAATPFVINGSCNKVGGGEILAVDLPGVSTTVPKVLQLILYFFKP